MKEAEVEVQSPELGLSIEDSRPWSKTRLMSAQRTKVKDMWEETTRLPETKSDRSWGHVKGFSNEGAPACCLLLAA